MAITPSNYAAWITTVDTTIGHLYTQLNPKITYKEWATTVPLAGSIYNAGWTGRMPKARPWFGSRMVHFPSAQTYQVEPIPYELTYAIDRFKLEDSDANGESIFWRMLPDMVRQWQMQPEYELRDLLENSGVQTGNRQLSTDGLAHFSTNHPIDIYAPTFNAGGGALFTGGTYSNDFRGGSTINGTSIGGALSVASFSSVLQYQQMIPGEDGEALGVMADTLMIPATLQVEANFILHATLLASPTWGAFSTLTGQVGSADNQLSKMGIRPLVNHFLRNPRNWYLMDTSQAVKPFLWIVREAPRTVPRTSESDPIVFDSHRWTWGGWDRVAPAFDFPFLCIKSGPTAGA